MSLLQKGDPNVDIGQQFVPQAPASVDGDISLLVSFPHSRKLKLKAREEMHVLIPNPSTVWISAGTPSVSILESNRDLLKILSCSRQGSH